MSLTDTKEGRLKIIIVVGVVVTLLTTGLRIADRIYADRAHDEAATIGREVVDALQDVHDVEAIDAAVDAVVAEHSAADRFGMSVGLESTRLFTIRVTRLLWSHCADVEWSSREDTVISLRTC